MSLRLSGATSGYTEIEAPAVAGSNTLTLPNSNGSNGQVLITNGSGTLSFATAATGDVTLTGTQTLTNKTLTAPTIASANLTTALTLAGAAGTNGQVLTSAGSGLPSWTTVSAGALTLLSTVTASNSATVDIETTFSSTYDRYIIEAIDIRSVDSGVIIGARYKLSGAYVTTTTYAFHRMQPDDGSAAYSGSALAAGAASSIGITAASGRSQFTMHITNPTSTTLQKLVYWTGGSISSDAVTVRAGAGLNQGTGALTGVRFFASTGNISSGTFRLYGISN